METLKAGCFLIDRTSNAVAIVYREKHGDFSFPKGHLEAGETPEEAAVRETAEETKRDCEIVREFPPFKEEYTTPSGERCVCYMYLAVDTGPSVNASPDTHPTRWIPFAEVEDILSYENLKSMWRQVKDGILKALS